MKKSNHVMKLNQHLTYGEQFQSAQDTEFIARCLYRKAYGGAYFRRHVLITAGGERAQAALYQAAVESFLVASKAARDVLDKQGAKKLAERYAECEHMENTLVQRAQGIEVKA